ASSSMFFFFSAPATTKIYTLSLHDALPISAARAARRDQTDVAVLLHAEADGLPPLVGLVVPVAAGVDADVAAEGGGVAQLWGRHEPGGGCEGRIAARDLGMRDHRAEGRRGADGQPRPSVAAHAGQLTNPAKSHQGLGLELAALHVREEIGAAGDEHGVGAAI